MNIRNKDKERFFSFAILSIIVSIILSTYYDLSFLQLFFYPIDDIYAPGDGRLALAVYKMVVAEKWSSLIIPFSPHLNAPFVYESY
ncbi:hypothetical protein OAB52_03335, partial [Candidatus Thioglobus sp.]|nr:hypothetical protein [Candidatus Thioglobus sp.]